MKDLIIIGAGDFSKEIRWLIERINQANPTWNILGFVDDGIPVGTDRDGLSILGGVDFLIKRETATDLVFAIADCKVKSNISQRLINNKNLSFPVVIDPTSIVSETALLEEGVVICAGTIVMPDAKLKSFANINLNCTLGHDVIVGEYSTIYPGCNISGKVTIGNQVEVGTGTKVIQGINIIDYAIIGAGAVVVKNIMIKGTYVGVPARKMD